MFLVLLLSCSHGELLSGNFESDYERLDHKSSFGFIHGNDHLDEVSLSMSLKEMRKLFKNNKIQARSELGHTYHVVDYGERRPVMYFSAMKLLAFVRGVIPKES